MFWSDLHYFKSQCFKDKEGYNIVAQTQYTVTSLLGVATSATEPQPLVMLAVVTGKTEFQAERTVISCFSIQWKYLHGSSDVDENIFKLQLKICTLKLSLTLFYI